MARPFKEEDYATRRSEIVRCAQRLVFRKGYEGMTIQDILTDLKISNGAFYHYFDSKSAVLEALVEAMQVQAEEPLREIVQASGMEAREKMRRFFALVEGSRGEHQGFLTRLVRVWYSDENALVRVKVHEATIERRLPWMAEIVAQGCKEGVFDSAVPEQTAQVVLALDQGRGNAMARLMLAAMQGGDLEASAVKVASTYAAFSQAIERSLGAREAFLTRLEPAAVRAWLTASEAIQGGES